MNRKLVTIPTKIISFLLIILGFQGCGNKEENGGGMVEYGTPTAKYEIKGTVVAKKDKAPIKEMRVVVGVKYGPEPQKIGGIDTLATNSKGEFGFVMRYSDIANLVVVAEDIDGQENLGEFKTREIPQAEMIFIRTEAGSGWNRGTFVADLGAVEMEEKEIEK